MCPCRMWQLTHLGLALAGCKDYPSAGEALQALMDRGEVRRATILPFPKWQAGQPPSSPAFDH